MSTIKMANRVTIRVPFEMLLLMTGALFFLVVGVGQLSADPLVTKSESVSPKEALTLFETHPGVEITLAAAEPDVIDPVSANFDRAGRLWVVEMRDYPTGPRGDAAPNGRIVVLSDDDQDGRFEQRSVFADGLLFPTGVLPWRDGAIVTLAGEIAFFTDRDGDGRSDEKQVWFAGFAEENTQLRASHPTLAADGRVYVAGGLRGGSVVARDPRWTTPQPIDLAGRDFAFDVRGGWCGSVVGKSQFGLSITEEGHRFVCDNRHPCRQVVFEEATLNQNPWLNVNEAVRDVSLSGPDSTVSSLTDAWTTSNLHAGQFTAACGLCVRLDRQGGPTDLLVCEPTANLVQRQKLSRDGVVFKGRRIAPNNSDGEQREWLSSSDVWFRPVDIAMGPDGATYVVDMYRAVIEHPQWVPEELKNRPDTWWGTERGRIWRLTEPGLPTGTPSPFAATDRPPAEIIAQGLASSIPLQRQFAIRLYFETEDVGPCESAFEEFLADPENANHADIVVQLAAARGILTETMVALATAHRRDDTVRAVLRSAPRRWLPDDYLSELIASGSTPQLFEALLAANDSESERLVKTIVDRSHDIVPSEPLTQALSSGNVRFSEALIRELLQDENAISADVESLLVPLAHRVGFGSEDQFLRQLIEELGETPLDWQQAGLDALATGLVRRRLDPAATIKSLGPPAQDVLDTVLQAARNRLQSRKADRRSVRLVGYYGGDSDRELILDVLDDPAMSDLHADSLEMLSRGDRASAARRIVENLARYDAATRNRALALVFRDVDATNILLDQLKEGTFPRGLLSVQQQGELRRHANRDIRTRVAEIFGMISGDRQALIARYRPLVESGGDPKAGRELFKKQCSACHQIDGVGTNVGPDISDSRTQTPIALLTSILDPNAAIDAAYLRSTLLTDDGRQLEGLLEEQTAERISLRQSDGTRLVLDPDQVVTIKKTGLSLMPEGFEQQLTPEALADVISYIKNWRYLGAE